MAVIKDSNGRAAMVDDDGRLTVFADIQPWEEHRNREGAATSTHFTVTPTGANDYFWYFKNTGTSNVFIHKIRLSSTVPTEITLESVTGTASAGTVAPTLSKNLGTPNSLIATNEFDVDFTGLTSNGIIYFEKCAVANTRYTIDSASNIIVPQGQAVALKRVAATGAIDVVVSLVIDSGVIRS